MTLNTISPDMWEPHIYGHQLRITNLEEQKTTVREEKREKEIQENALAVLL